MLGCYISAPHFTRAGKTRSRGFSENTYTCSAVEPFLLRTFIKSQFLPDSKCFRACLCPYSMSLIKCLATKVRLPVVLQVFLYSPWWCELLQPLCSPSLLCVIRRSNTVNDPTTAALVQVAHRLEGREKKEIEIFLHPDFFPKYSKESELPRRNSFVWLRPHIKSICLSSLDVIWF